MTAYDKLIELLCIIHRDGGQYIDQHGDDKAFEDAKTVLYQWREDHDEAERRKKAGGN